MFGRGGWCVRMLGIEGYQRVFEGGRECCCGTCVEEKKSLVTPFDSKWSSE